MDYIITDIKKFPRMLYHPTKEPVTVNSVGEMEGYLSRGWSKTPATSSSMEELDSQIAELEDSLAELYRVRKELVEERELANAIAANNGQLSPLDTDVAQPPTPAQAAAANKTIGKNPGSVAATGK